MRLRSLDIRIIKSLYAASNGLDEVTLFRRQRVSFADFATSVRSLENLGLIEYQDQIYKITDQGARKFIALGTFVLSDRKKRWREIPTDFIGDSISREEIYIPSLTRLSKSGFIGKSHSAQDLQERWK